MSHQPVRSTSPLPQSPDVAISQSLPVMKTRGALDAQRRVLFAQRLAVLIKRMRTAPKEDSPDDR